jgi:predicted amidohydrolase
MQDIVNVIAIQMEIPDESDRDGNLKKACGLLEAAGARRSDLACLPELFTGLKAISTVPGPETEEIGSICRKHHMYVVAPFYVRQEGFLFNCSVLLDREGKTGGVYRKVHLWPWEAPVFGVRPGEEFPVFRLDFGMLGLCICHDHQFPETARTLALKGAELICCSTRMPDPFQIPWLDLSRIRALENQAYIVSVGASFNDGSTHIVGPWFRGAVIASAGTGVHLVEAGLDLKRLRDERERSPLYSFPKEVPSEEAARLLAKVRSHCFLKERRPQAYIT